MEAFGRNVETRSHVIYIYRNQKKHTKEKTNYRLMLKRITEVARRHHCKLQTNKDCVSACGPAL
jgi:hypothetical protein